MDSDRGFQGCTGRHHRQCREWGGGMDRDRTRLKFADIKDIKGQKVVTGLMPTTSTSLFMKLLKENGMDAKTDVEMIQVAIGSEPGPFVAKQADVAVMYEPGLDQAVAKGMKVVLGFPKFYGAYAF